MQPSCCPRRFHQLVLEKLIGVDPLDQGIPEDMALCVRAGRPVRVKERHLTGRVGNFFSVYDKRADVDLPFRFPITRDGAGANAAGGADLSALRVAHAPRLDWKDDPFLVRATWLAGYVF